MVQAKMKPGSSILIHAGMGGVGQACINYCLHYDCEVFTTVGSDEKRTMLKKLYPQIRGGQRFAVFNQYFMEKLALFSRRSHWIYPRHVVRGYDLHSDRRKRS
jgi:hypothetical protein